MGAPEVGTGMAALSSALTTSGLLGALHNFVCLFSVNQYLPRNSQVGI